MTKTLSKLETLPWLRALPASRRRELERHSIVHSVAPGTVLFEQGELPGFQYVLLSGSIHLLGRSITGHEVLIEVVEPPDLVVPAAVATGQPFLMRAQVSEPSRLVLIQADAFREAVLREPLLAQQVIASLAGQFRRLVRQIKNLKLRTATERVGCYLLALSKRQGTPHSAILPYEKKLIASELGITRESFSRALSALQKHGVEVRNASISIQDQNRLAAACGLDPLIDAANGPLPIHEAASIRPFKKARTRRSHK